jgi:glucose/mannose transport system substrate-binding protein
MAKDFQESFNLVKGSIPARNDIGPDNFDPCGQKAMADIAEAQKNGALLGSMSQGNGQTAAVQRAFYDVVTEFLNSDMSSEDAVAELQSAVEAAM